MHELTRHASGQDNCVAHAKWCGPCRIKPLHTGLTCAGIPACAGVQSNTSCATPHLWLWCRWWDRRPVLCGCGVGLQAVAAQACREYAAAGSAGEGRQRQYLCCMPAAPVLQTCTACHAAHMRWGQYTASHTTPPCQPHSPACVTHWVPWGPRQLRGLLLARGLCTSHQLHVRLPSHACEAPAQQRGRTTRG